jgi:toxin ParE1/3/4
MASLVIAPAAKQDLSDIFDYISRDKPMAAANWVETIEQNCKLIAATPEFGERRPEFGVDIRSSAVGRYVIFFRPVTGGIDTMTSQRDATEAIREMAASFPEVAKGTSCNQSSFRAGRGAFLFIGPGAKGQGYKAMFKLDKSMAQAQKLAAENPDRFHVGSTGWVTARFSDDQPLPRSIWQKWLRESYAHCTAPKKSGKKK